MERAGVTRLLAKASTFRFFGDFSRRYRDTSLCTFHVVEERDRLAATLDDVNAGLLTKHVGFKAKFEFRVSCSKQSKLSVQVTHNLTLLRHKSAQ